MRNALNSQLLTEILTALERIEAATDIYAAILTGNGSAFSAGGDIPTVQDWPSAERSEFEPELDAFQDIVSQLRSMSTPSGAAVNGPVVGAGCDIALACDVRVVSPDAELIEGFVTIGLVSGDGGTWLLPRLVGESRAKQYLLTGDPITADTAVDIGLAVEQTETVVDSARAFAERLRDLPAAAVAHTKELVIMRFSSAQPPHSGRAYRTKNTVRRWPLGSTGEAPTSTVPKRTRHGALVHSPCRAPGREARIGTTHPSCGETALKR